jgi:hypothetical protein
MQWPRNLLVLALYCAFIWAMLDVVYSNFIFEERVSGRVADAHYHHGFAPKFQGEEGWGRSKNKLITNSLGLKDFAPREVALVPDGCRMVVIGDSFTEGVGLAFEDTFAGRLYAAGQQRAKKIEVLNAGVSSYSPTLYARKIERLLDRGVQFDEVVAFVDISDIADEATSYFCFDRHDEYKRLCTQEEAPASVTAVNRKPFFTRNFNITNWAVLSLKYKIGLLFRDDLWQGRSDRGRAVVAFATDETDIGAFFDPLGIEGGITRAVKNMTELSDTLKARGIALSVAVYPWPANLVFGVADNRQVRIWRQFCEGRCRQFVDLFPAFLDYKNTHANWYDDLYIKGDVHFNKAGNNFLYRQAATRLIGEPAPWSRCGQTGYDRDPR